MNVFKRIWNNIKQHFNAFRTDTFSIKNKGSWANYLFIFIGVIGAVFLLFGNFFASDKIENKHTKTGQYYKLDTSNKVKIDKWLWNKKTNTLDVVLEYKTIDDNSLQENNSYNYVARANDNASKKLDIKTVSNADNRVALRINDVKKGFEVLGLEIYKKTDGSKKQKVKSLLANEQYVSKTNNKNLKNHQDYLLEFIKNDKKDVEKSIKNSEKKVKKYEEKIKDKESEMSKLDDEKEYQTESEKSKTDTKINSIKDEIRELELNIDREKDTIDEEKESKKLLNSKYKDTKEFNE